MKREITDLDLSNESPTFFRVREESCRKNVLLTSFRLHYIVHSHRGRSRAGHGSWSFCFLRHSHNGNGDSRTVKSDVYTQ